MIITTAGRTTAEYISKAKELADLYKIPYQNRNGASIKSLQDRYQHDIVVVGKEGLYIVPLHENQKIFFHPNLAMVRAKRVLNGEEDPLISTAKLREGHVFLDCTLGIASDSIIASLAVGTSGSVIGIEGDQLLYMLANEGLSSFTSGSLEFDQAMRRIQVIHEDHVTFLQQAESNSVDIVYFDPMFLSAVETSSGINSIRGLALSTELTIEVISEAKRVARERVVLKDHWKSERFAQLGFKQHKRKTSLFHFGTIELT